MTYLIVLNFILAAFAQNNTCKFYEGNPGPVCRSVGCASLTEGCQSHCRLEGHFLYIFPEYEQIVTDIGTCEKTCLSNVNCGAFNFWPDKYNFTQTNVSTSDLSNGNNIGLCEIGLSIHETVEKSSEQGQAFVCDEAVPTSPPTVAPVELCNYFQEDCRQNGCARINGRCQTTCVDTQTTLFSLNKRSAKVRRVSDRDECENMCLNDEHCVAFNYFLTARLCHFGTPVKSADVRFVDLALVQSGLCDVSATTSLPFTTPSIAPTTPIPSESPSIAITTTTRDEHNSVYPSKSSPSASPIIPCPGLSPISACDHRFICDSCRCEKDNAATPPNGGFTENIEDCMDEAINHGVHFFSYRADNGMCNYPSTDLIDCSDGEQPFEWPMGDANGQWSTYHIYCQSGCQVQENWTTGSPSSTLSHSPSTTPSHLPTYESNPEPSATPAKIPSTHFRICDFSNTQQAVTCLQNYIQSQVEEFNQLSQQIEDRFKTVQSICSARYDDAFSHLLNITSRTC